MTPATLNTIINLKCGTSDTTFPQADKLKYVNIFKDEIASLAVQKNNTLWIIPSLDDLVADQREYAWPADVLNHLADVEVAFASATPLAYVKLKGVKREDYNKSLTEANIASDFNNLEPMYFKRRRAIYLLTGSISSTVLGAATIANAMRITYRAWPADLADLTGAVNDIDTDPSTTTFGFPRALHELLARRVAIEYKQNRPKPLPLSAKELQYEVDLERALQGLATEDLSESVVAQIPYDEGTDY